MNYGKFFRLNQNISKIEDGVAIYDYIDLPAYFELSESNKMSPKYPISVTITENCVRFRVHYSAYKIGDGTQSVGYYYDVKKAFDSENNDETSLKHKEQVIIELPYINDSVDKLHQAIKDIYCTRYPIFMDKQTFIYLLIHKRYVKDSQHLKGLEKNLYHKIQDDLDEDFSYSTLWLMDIVEKEEGSNKFFNLFGKGSQEKVVTKFLRKLLLDFMFDLNHSDVFQTSKYYEAMYSGLMANFYFSALMHKCEYYFYRGLITDVIQKRISTIKTRKIHICNLYAKKLFEAEDLWIHDIMSSSAEKYFEHFYTKENNNGLNKSDDKKVNNRLKIKAIIEETWREYKAKIKEEKERYTFRSWDSWFSSPEEEMRRVCFTMRERVRIGKDSDYSYKDGDAHICNAETITHYIDGSYAKIDNQLIRKKDANKAQISQWFLKRYAFNDVFHLHLFKYANRLFFLTLSIILILLFLLPNSVSPDFWKEWSCMPLLGAILLIELYCVWGKEMYEKYKHQSDPHHKNLLLLARSRLVWSRVKAIGITLLWALIVFSTVNRAMNSICPWMTEESPRGTFIKIFVILSQAFLVFVGGWVIHKKIYPVHWLSNMHVFFPRLVASIAAAWISLAVGNELFGSFFDSIVSWSTSIWLTVIVFAFVMYEINKLLPLETTFNKVKRCLGIIAISYMVSLIAGLFIINFTGERFLERSDTLKSFYQDYVINNNQKQVENKGYYTHYLFRTKNKQPHNIHLQISDASDRQLIKGLERIHITPQEKTSQDGLNHPIATIWNLSGGAKFFILRDFLIQFAFVAMFIGIFIQMLFEEKSITEV